MYYIVETEKSFEQAAADLESAVTRKWVRRAAHT